MFRRDRKHVKAEAAIAAQAGSIDPKTVAEFEAGNIRNELMLRQIHPWAADNVVQARLACYAIVYLNDRLAEIMMQNAMTRNRKRPETLPIQIDSFVQELSRLALERLDYVQKRLLLLREVGFDEETRKYLYVANNMPNFPEYPYGFDRETPYGRSIASGTVTVAFVQALNMAGLEVQGRANSLSIELAKFPVDMPQLYEKLLDVLRQGYIYGAEDNSRMAASNLEAMAPGRVDFELLSSAYELAYKGYMDAAFAYTALHCPAVMGPEWILQQY